MLDITNRSHDRSHFYPNLCLIFAIFKRNKKNICDFSFFQGPNDFFCDFSYFFKVLMTFFVFST